MPQTLHPAHQFFLQTASAFARVGNTGRSARALKLCEGKLREFECLLEIFCSTFIVNGELFAGFEAVRRVAGQLVLECRRGVAVAPAFGHEREFTRGVRPEFGRESRVQRLDTC